MVRSGREVGWKRGKTRRGQGGKRKIRQEDKVAEEGEK